MPAWGMQNGAWREMWANYSMVNGVWRANNNSVLVNHVWRQIYKYDIDEEDIVGFRLVYTLDKERIHPQFPHLPFNPDLPIKMDITGDTSGDLSTEAKGVIFEYFRDNPDITGSYVYTASLFAIITDGTLINMATTSDNVGDEWQYTSPIPGGETAWHSARPRNLCIDVDLELRYEDYGYFLGGWNHFLGTEDVMDKYSPPTRVGERFVITFPQFTLLPVQNRHATFNGDIAIGIARDIKTRYTNMLGNHGILDQSIHKIVVNGIRKPFVIEIYD